MFEEDRLRTVLVADMIRKRSFGFFSLYRVEASKVFQQLQPRRPLSFKAKNRELSSWKTPSTMTSTSSTASYREK